MSKESSIASTPSPALDGPRLEVDGDGGAGLVVEVVPEPLHDLLVDLRREQPGLAGVAAEDVAEARRDDDLEAVVLQRPHGVLARRAGAEVGAGDEHRAGGVLGSVEHEAGVVAPGREQPVLEAGAGDPLEVDGRDDLVGVDVAAAQRDADAGVAW